MSAVLLTITYPKTGDDFKESDFFDLSLFHAASAESETRVTHDYKYGKTKERADCFIKKSGVKCVDVVYRKSDLNRKHGNRIGTLRIHFASDALEVVTRVEWKDGDKKEFIDKDFEFSVSDPDELDDADGDFDGKKRVRTHVNFEKTTHFRDRKIIARKKRESKEENGGRLKCEACEFDFQGFYGEIGRDFCEVHHLFPIENGERKTKTEDLAVLCSNCHRMIHRFLAKMESGGETKPGLYTLKAFKNRDRKARPPKSKAG